MAIKNTFGQRNSNSVTYDDGHEAQVCCVNGLIHRRQLSLYLYKLLGTKIRGD